MPDSNLPRCTVCLQANTLGGLYCGVSHCNQPPLGLDPLGYADGMIRYEGHDTDGMGGRVVKITPTYQSVPLRARLDIRNHSPTGFSWGYEGSGPAQLALAILVDLFDDIPWALHHYQEFKRKVIAAMPQGTNWALTKEQIVQVTGTPTSHSGEATPASHNSQSETSHNAEPQR